jgi:sec-independent protein translocase protein TatB
MFDLHWTELILVMLITLLVVGPKDLPKVMRTVGALMHKVRSVAGEFQSGLDQIAREAELDDLKNQARQARSQSIEGHIKNTVDPHGELDISRGPRRTGNTDAGGGSNADAAEADSGPAEPWPDGSGDEPPVRPSAASSPAASPDNGDATTTDPAPQNDQDKRR